MKKFIAAIDGLKYSSSTVAYATELAKQTNAHLVGVFLEDFTYHSYKIYELIRQNGAEMEEKREQMEQKDKETRENAVFFFEQACRNAGINYSVHHDRNIAIHELLHESIYADLVLIDNKETLTHYDEEVPTRFIRDLLEQVQCPVLVVPSKYQPVQMMILLYDGSPSSVIAIRASSYVLGDLNNLEVEVLSVNDVSAGKHVPDNRLMKEFMKRHFPDAVYTGLSGNAETEIVRHINKQTDHPVVVLGAYRRGTVSRWFKHSMADALMQKVSVPLFITH